MEHKEIVEGVACFWMGCLVTFFCVAGTWVRYLCQMVVVLRVPQARLATPESQTVLLYLEWGQKLGYRANHWWP